MSLRMPADSVGQIRTHRLDRDHLLAALKLAGVFVVTVTLVLLSHEFSRNAGRVASIWPLNAFLLALLMRQPSSRWAAILGVAAAGNLAVNAALGDSMWTAPLLVGANVAEVLICARLLKRPGETFDITRTPDLLRYIGVAGGLAPAVSSVIAATTLVSSQPFAGTLGMWFAADSLGMLVFGPAFLVLATVAGRTMTLTGRLGEIGLSLLVLASALLAVFWQTSYPLLFLVPPALTLATFRLGIGGAAGGILLTAVIAIAFTVAGLGPAQLVDGSEAVKAIVLQSFLAVMSLTTLPIAAAIAQFKRVRDDLERARADAVASETHYRTLADYSTDIVLRFGPGGIISYASPACATLGFKPEQVIGRSITEFAAPEDRAFSSRTTDALFSGPEPDRTIRREFRVTKPDGSIRWLEGSPNIIRNAAGEPVEVVSTYRDITARRELEEELINARQRADSAAAAARESEARYRTMSDISLDMIARIDMDATIRFVSPSSALILGFAPDELIGTKTIDHMHPDDVPGVIDFFTDLRAAGPEGPVLPYRYRARRKDGEYIWLEGIPRILYTEDGTPLEIQDSARDVTQRTRLEHELSEAKIAAEAAATAKADFLANMSHELRTPLNSVIGFSRLLTKSNGLSPTDRRHVDLINASSQGLLAIVNDILDFSSLEGAAVRLESLPFSVASAVRNCTEAMRVQADAKNLQLDFTIDDAVAKAHVGDKARLNQILINLIGNAIKFTSIGAISIRVTASPTADDAQKLRFEVRDTGIGIPAERQHALFTRFSQVDSSINRRFGGTGLGLAICRHLVDLMGGEIGVTSTLDMGSRFWFEVDFLISEGLAVDRLNTTTLPAHSIARRILVVDDVDLNRELALALLADSGHTVDVASDGAEAVAMALSGSYDVIFMDVQMPGMDGLAATRAIRSTPSLELIPIIAMTAQALPAQITACRAAGMVDHLVKPIAPDGLQTMIEKWSQSDTAAKPSPPLSDVMTGLRARFVERSRADRTRLGELLAISDSSGRDELRALIHRFAGTAGTFGFAEVGDIAIALDQDFAAGRTPPGDHCTPLLEALDTIFRDA